MGLGLLDMQEILKAVTALTSLLRGVKPSPTPPPKYLFYWTLWQRFTFPYGMHLYPCCGVCYHDGLKSVSATRSTLAPDFLKLWLRLPCWWGGMILSLFYNYCLELTCLTLITILRVHLYPFPLSTFSQDELFLLDLVVTCMFLLYKSVHLPQQSCVSQLSDEERSLELKVLNNLFPFLLPFHKFPCERSLLLISWVLLDS